jgi:hypothetical protein
MFVEKEGFGKGVMWCSNDRQEHKVGHMKNVICKVCKCYPLSLSVVQLSVTSLSSQRVSCKVSIWRNLLGKGVRSSSSSFRWCKGRQHATKCMYILDVLMQALVSIRPIEGGGGRKHTRVSQFQQIRISSQNPFLL